MIVRGQRIILLAMLAATVYAISLPSGFYMDDESRVSQNPAIQTFWPPWRHFLDPSTMANMWLNGLWRDPVALFGHAALYPVEGKGLDNLALALMNSDPSHPAIDPILLEAIRRQPQEQAIRFHLGMHWVSSPGRTERGLAVCRDVLSRTEGYSEGHRILAGKLLELNQPGDAWWAARESVRIDPSNPVNRDAAVQAACAAGRHADCVEQFDAAARIGTVTPAMALGYARSLAALGRCAEAVRAYARMVTHRPEDGTARAELERTRRQCQLDSGPSPLPPPVSPFR